MSDAFLSYPHGDGDRVAAALQRGLHTFARPWYQWRALSVFRDATNLDLAGVWSRIEDGLRGSKFLVLLTSPKAASATGVCREVAYWLEHCDPDASRVLLVLTEGTIRWDSSQSDFDWETTDAVPAPLRNRFKEEPLFLDLRWTSDSTAALDLRNPRFADGVATLAARLHGRPKDELAGEDVRRHRQTLRWTWGAAVTLMLLTAALAVAVFLIQRSLEAEQRARGLAEEREQEAVRGRILAEAERAAHRPGQLHAAAWLGAHVLANGPEVRADAVVRRALRQLVPLTQRRDLQGWTIADPFLHWFLTKNRRTGWELTRLDDSERRQAVGLAPSVSALEIQLASTGRRALRFKSGNEETIRDADGLFWDHYEVVVVDLESGAEVFTRPALTVSAPVLSPDGRMVAILDGSPEEGLDRISLTVHDLDRGGAELLRLTGQFPASPAFSLSPPRLAIQDATNLTIYDVVPDGLKVAFQYPAKFRHLVMGENGRLLAGEVSDSGARGVDVLDIGGDSGGRPVSTPYRHEAASDAVTDARSPTVLGSWALDDNEFVASVYEKEEHEGVVTAVGSAYVIRDAFDGHPVATAEARGSDAGFNAGSDACLTNNGDELHALVNDAVHTWSVAVRFNDLVEQIRTLDSGVSVGPSGILDTSAFLGGMLVWGPPTSGWIALQRHGGVEAAKVSGGTMGEVLKFAGPWEHAEFSADAKALMLSPRHVFGGAEENITLFDLTSQEEWRPQLPTKTRIDHVLPLGPKRVVASLRTKEDGNSLFLYDDARPGHELLHRPQRIQALASDPQARFIVAAISHPEAKASLAPALGGEPARLLLFDVERPDVQREWAVQGSIFQLAMTAGGESIVAVSSDHGRWVLSIYTGGSATPAVYLHLDWRASGINAWFEARDLLRVSYRTGSDETVLEEIRFLPSELVAAACDVLGGDLSSAVWQRHMGNLPYRAVCMSSSRL